MSEWKFFKIDTWWKALLLLGILATVGSMVFKSDFVKNNHLFGLGLGLIMIGIAHWIAWVNISTFAMGGILQTKIIKHNIASIILLIIGIGFAGLFLFLIVKGLI